MLVLFPWAADDSNMPRTDTIPDFPANEIIVKLGTSAKSSEFVAAIGAFKAAIGAQTAEQAPHLGFELWVTETPLDAALLAQVASAPWYPLISNAIEYIQPNYQVQRDTIVADSVPPPNDPRFDDLWGLENTGQTGGTVDADIDAIAAWEFSDGTGIIIGVIDSGVDYTHPDINDNMWINTGEIAGNGIDDDGNGYVDDVYGYDFHNNDGDPFDDDNHGTHVAGTIAAEANNGIGVTGIAHGAQIMALKFLDENGDGATFDAVQALEYALVMEADLTNNSWGGGSFSTALRDAISQAQSAGQLFVASAGNNYNRDIDSNPKYPASYNISNVLTVASSTDEDERSNFSNIGPNTVDVTAPGSGILSTIPGGDYAFFNGTSMAAPHVSGIAALLLAQDPTLTPEQIIQRLIDTSDPVTALNNVSISDGRVNAGAAVFQTPIVGSIEGTVWEDTDGDGVRNPSEIGLSGWQVFLDGNGNGMFDNGEVTVSTLSDGSYRFDDLALGDYTVGYVVKPGYVQTAPMVPTSYAATTTTYNWEDISGTGVALSLGDDDAALVTLPFDFKYYNSLFDTVTVGSNGYLTFDGDGTAYANSIAPTDDGIIGFIAPFWTDLNPARAGTVYISSDVVEGRFIVQWDSVAPFSGQGTYTFQAILEADGDIIFQYASMTGALNHATTGIESPDQISGLQLAYNTAYVAGEMAVSLAQGQAASATQVVTVTADNTVSGIDFGNKPDTTPPTPGDIIGTPGADSLEGTASDDRIFGRAGDDTLFGRGGQDYLDGEEGDDELRGQDDQDTLIGGLGNDTLNGNAGDDQLEGGAENDVLFGNPGDDVLDGGDGNDQLSGNEDNDLLLGSAGQDSLFGGSGSDNVRGGSGDDFLSGDDDRDTLDGGDGNDRVFGGRGDDVIDGGDGNDQVFGNAGSDVIIGGLGNDRLSGVGGADTLRGNAGDDTLLGNGGSDSLEAGDGQDRLFGESADDTLKGGAGDDALYGGTGDDSLQGGTGDDTLMGDDGNDILAGSTGTDVLMGGAGNDTLDGGRAPGIDRSTGGAGADTFLYHSGDDRLTITDFNVAEGDVIDLTGIDLSDFGLWAITSVAGGTATLVQFDGSGEIRFDSATPADVDASWFI